MLSREAIIISMKAFYSSCHKKLMTIVHFVSSSSRSSSLFIKTTIIAMLLIVYMNFKFGTVAHHHLVKDKYPAWTQNPEFSSMSTYLAQPPTWRRPPATMYERDLLTCGEVNNSTIKRLIKISNDANIVIRKASFDINVLPDNEKNGEVQEIVEISPLLFGGFIEHMGRVIDGNFGNDGGIWAELLSDRKFYFELTSSFSTKDSSKTGTKSPWLVRKGVGSYVSSPRSRALSLVRAGRVVVIQFPTTDTNSQTHSEDAHIKTNQHNLDQNKKTSFLVEEDDGESDQDQAPSSDQALKFDPWRAEIEQSGLSLNKGRSYRGYIWLSTLGLTHMANSSSDGSSSSSGGEGPSKTRSGLSSLDNPHTDELTDESSLLLVEVWLNFRSRSDKEKYPPKLLARVSNQELMTMMERQQEAVEHMLDESGPMKEGSSYDQYQGIQHMERQGKWRRFNFGFQWSEDDIAECACGVTSQADCAGDCRSGVGSGGFNDQNLNGAKPGIGEDKLGYCGECGAAITVVGRRIELNHSTASRKEDQTIPTILIGAISLMPTDAEHGMFRSETMELLRTLRPTIMRWPGGNFVSGYNWRDGIGPRDARPSRKNSAWAGIVSNDFGVHEFMLLCSLIDALPMIVVNSGLGTAIEAAALVSYVNTPVGQNFLEDHDLHITRRRKVIPSDSAAGREEAFRRDLRDRLGTMMYEEPRRRAKNGEVLPWNCQWWGIGNEMYGEWQLGHVPFNEYRERHIRFAEAMKTVSSNIKLIGVGALHLPTSQDSSPVNLDGNDYGFNSSWTGRLMKELSGGHYLDAVSEHFYVDEEKPLAAMHAKQASWRVTRFASVYRGLHRHLKQFMQSQHLRLPTALPGICLDEFGYWYGPAEFGQLGTRSSLKDSLGVAVAIHAMMRNADVYSVATYSQSVNVFGAIKTTKHSAALDPVGLLLSLYSRVFAHPKPYVVPSTSSTPQVPIGNETKRIALQEDRRSRLNTIEFGAPTAPFIRALSLRGFSDLKLVNIEIEGTPNGYAAGSPIRLVDAIAALRTDEGTSNSPPIAKLTMAFVNLYDANVVSIRMSKTNIVSMLRAKNRNLLNSFEHTLKLNLVLDPEMASESILPDESEELLVGKCWALHDSCLTDISSPTTVSPSCPDHTAMNTPSADWLLGSNRESRVSSMSSVVLNRIPPEWTQAKNILKIVENPFLDSLKQQMTPSPEDEVSGKHRTHSESKKKKQKRNIKKKMKDKEQKDHTKGSTVNQSPSSVANMKKTKKDDQFLFQGEVSLIPLSATAYE